MDAFNARAFDSMPAMLADAFVYIDSTGSELSGRDNVLHMMEWLAEADPSFRQEASDCTARDDLVLLRGQEFSSSSQEPGRVLWEARLQDNKIAQFSSFRADGAIPIVQLYRRSAEAQG